jgi:hypothetical protein
VSNPLAGVDPRWLLYGAAVAVLGYVGWKLSKAAAAGAGVAAEAVQSVVAAVNPADEKNIVNRGVSAAGAAVTGDESWTLGGQLAEWFSPEVRAANESLRNPPPAKPAAPAPAWSTPEEPLSPFNVGA